MQEVTRRATLGGAVSMTLGALAGCSAIRSAAGDHLTIESGSMEPTLVEGRVVTIDPVCAGLGRRLADVIVYQRWCSGFVSTSRARQIRGAGRAHAQSSEGPPALEAGEAVRVGCVGGGDQLVRLPLAGGELVVLAALVPGDDDRSSGIRSLSNVPRPRRSARPSQPGSTSSRNARVVQFGEPDEEESGAECLLVGFMS